MSVLAYARAEWAEACRSVAGASDLVVWDMKQPPPRSDIEFLAPDYPIDSAAFDHVAELPQAQVVQLLSSGYEYVGDRLPAGVTLCNGRGLHSTATAELTLGLILAAQRDMTAWFDAQRRATWEVLPTYPPGIADRTVLIVGYGDVAQALARRLVACEASVTAVARTARPGDGVAERVAAMDELPALLPQFDIVVTVVPHTPATHHLVNADFLARLRDGSLLVNIGRGGLLDTNALLAELQTGRLRAALDVTDPEPLPDGHPLWSAPGVIISPHMGGRSQAQFPRTLAYLVEQTRRFVTGEPLLNVVVAGRRV